jgi:hypothetical protein
MSGPLAFAANSLFSLQGIRCLSSAEPPGPEPGGFLFADAFAGARPPVHHPFLRSAPGELTEVKGDPGKLPA